MGAADVVAQKAKVVDTVKGSMDKSALAFCVRTAGIQVNDMNMMRQKMPETVDVRCVKNTLFKRAAADYPQFQGGDELLEYSNYWFFVPEADMRATVDTWNGWVKETKQDDNAITGGIYEGKALDTKGVAQIAKLPTKQELMGQTAIMLKKLPTNLARALKEAQGQKLARAVDKMKDTLG